MSSEVDVLKLIKGKAATRHMEKTARVTQEQVTQALCFGSPSCCHPLSLQKEDEQSLLPPSLSEHRVS